MLQSFFESVRKIANVSLLLAVSLSPYLGAHSFSTYEQEELLVKEVPASVQLLVSIIFTSEAGYEQGVNITARVQSPDGTVQNIPIVSPLLPLAEATDGGVPLVTTFLFNYNTNSIPGLYTVGLVFEFPQVFSGELSVTSGQLSVIHSGAIVPGFTRAIAHNDFDPSRGPVWFLPIDIR